MGKVEIRWDMAKLGRFCAKAPETAEEIDKVVSRIASSASAMSSGLATGTAPVYGSNTQVMANSAVGIAYTGNIEAEKDNMKHNTLLHAMDRAGR